MDKNCDNINHKLIQKLLREYTLEQKTNITFALINFIPYAKPDILFNVNHNPIEIAHCLISHNSSFLSDLNSTSENITVNFDRIYKIFNSNSNLIGKPFPETSALRLRINLKSN